jgi:excisionase family DNA binding protein
VTIARSNATEQISPSVDALGEVALLRAAINRDQRAWREFVARYEPHLREVIAQAAADVHELEEDEVDDVVGDLWLLLLEDDLRRLRGLRANHDGAVRTWLALFASQLACNRARKLARAPKTVSLDEVSDTLPAASEPESPLLDVDAVARRWGVNVKTIYGMIQRGELRAVRMGRLVRIARVVVESFEQGRAVSGRK